MPPLNVLGPVYLVGSSERTDPRDCMVYLIGEPGGKGVLIDSGAGPSAMTILQNVQEAGVDPSGITDLLLTHCHIDHVGGAPDILAATGCKVWCHAGDKAGVCGENPERTAESWYGLDYNGVEADVVLGRNPEHYEAPEHTDGSGELEGGVHGLKGPPAVDLKGAGPWKMETPAGDLTILHTPGHTPGSISAYMDLETEEGPKRVLFAQDAHGPFDPAWGSDREEWFRSIVSLLELDADYLCEGHYGIFKSAQGVREYLEGLLD